jgi:hypothetical protein
MRRFAVLAVTALAVAGCGPGGAERDARGVAERFYAAAQARQGERACDLMTDAARSALADQERAPCRRAAVELELAGGQGGATKVYIDQAQVRMAGGDTVFLSDGPQGWRVDAAGCRPTGADRPYDCEVES